MAEAEALRILSREMSDKGDDYRTDSYGIEALCLSNAADLIDEQARYLADLRDGVAKLRAENAKLKDFVRAVIRYGGNAGDDYLADQARAALNEEKKDG